MTALRSVLSLGAIPVALGVLSAAVGCNTGGGGGEAQTATQIDSRMHSQATVVANAAAMPACNAQTHNNLMYLSDTGTYQSCFVDEKGKYAYGDVDIRPKTATGNQVALQLSGTSELPYCNYFNRGLIAFVKPTKTIYACEEWAPNYWRFGWKDITVKGEVGAKGATGDKGAKGDKGDTGDTGATGAKGATGDAGADGAKGATGDQGLAGDKGATGDIGAQGAKGATGDTGAQGAKGETGDKGLAGAKGDVGDQGAQGDQGAKGETGDAGTGCTRSISYPYIIITCGDTQARFDRSGQFSFFSVGKRHVCASNDRGETSCWGANDHGQLGLQNVTQTSTPTRIPSSGDSRVPSAAGDTTCSANSNHIATCWGRNYDDGIGAGPADNDIKVPRTIPGASNTLRVAQQEDAGGCIQTQAETVACWGFVSRPNAPRTPPGTSGGVTDSAVTVIDGLSRIIQVAVSASGVACALDRSGVLKCWGKNGPDKIIEHTDRDIISKPTIRMGVPRLKQIAMGNRSICGISNEGQIWCWGSSINNSLGIATESPIGMTPFKKTDLKYDFLKIFGGPYNYCARQNATGKFFCWGDNSYRKLGNSVAADSVSYEIHEIDNTYTFVEAAIGETLICARTFNGRGHCWGSNSHGQLGNGQIGGESAVPVPVIRDNFLPN